MKKEGNTNDPINVGASEAVIAKSEELKHFAYQNGLKESAMSSFLHNVQERLRESNSKQESAIYHNAAIELDRRGGLDNDGSLLGFQEDRDSHLALQELPLQQRMLVVLHLVNGKKLSLAAEVLQLEESDARDLVEKAQAVLCRKLMLRDSEELDLRLSFLAKSYKRLKLPEVELPSEVAEAVSTTKHSEEKKISKPVIWVVGASLILFAAIIGGSFFLDSFSLPSTSQAEEGQLTRERAEELEQLYANTRADAKGRLGLDEEQFAAFDYVTAADQQKETLFSRTNLQEHIDDAERFEHQMEELLWMVETPKGMTEKIAETGSLARDEMDRFLHLYIEKTAEVQAHVQETLKLHREHLPAQSSNYAEPQLLLNEIPDAPQELEQLLATWPEYAMHFRLSDEDQRYLVVRNTDGLLQLPQVNTHPFSSFYLQILAGYPFFDEDGWLVEPDRLNEPMQNMLYLLLHEPSESSLEADVEVMYEQTFWQIVKGSDTEIYEDGTVKPEIRKLWKSLASADPMAAILLPILDEMEDSDWQSSTALENLEYGDSLEMLELERRGELGATLPNGDLPLESELVDLADFDYSRVEELYNRFESSHDRMVLAGEQPMDIFLLYFYANHVEDAETMWHLLTDSDLKPSLKKFVDDWKPLPELTEEAMWVEIQKEATQRVFKKIVIYPQVAHDGERNGFHQMNPLQPALVTEGDNIWLVQYELAELSEGNNPVLAEQGRNAYDTLSDQTSLPVQTSPLVIAYALLHAVDEENREVAGVLLNSDDDEEIDDSFWGSFASSHQVGGFDNLAEITFTSTDLNVQETAVGNLEIRYETEQGNQWYENLQMVQTLEGWRFELFPNY